MTQLKTWSEVFNSLSRSVLMKNFNPNSEGTLCLHYLSISRNTQRELEKIHCQVKSISQKFIYLEGIICNWKQVKQKACWIWISKTVEHKKWYARHKWWQQIERRWHILKKYTDTQSMEIFLGAINVACISVYGYIVANIIE